MALFIIVIYEGKDKVCHTSRAWHTLSFPKAGRTTEIKLKQIQNCFSVLFQFHFTCASVWNKTVLFQFYFSYATGFRLSIHHYKRTNTPIIIINNKSIFTENNNVISQWSSGKAAFTPGQHVAGNMLRGNILPATSCSSTQHVVGNMLLVASNMLPVSRQRVSLCIQQQTGNKLATILLTATSNMLPAGNMFHWCKRGLRCLLIRQIPGSNHTVDSLSRKSVQ